MLTCVAISRRCIAARTGVVAAVEGGQGDWKFNFRIKQRQPSSLSVSLTHTLSLLLSIITTIIICLEVSDAKVKKCVVIPKFASVKWKTSNNIAAYGETGSCMREREQEQWGEGQQQWWQRWAKCHIKPHSGLHAKNVAAKVHTGKCVYHVCVQCVCVRMCVCGLCMCVCVYEMCHVDSVEMSLMRRRNEFCQHRVAQSPQPQPTKYPCKCSLTPALPAILLSLCIQNFAVQLSTTRRMSNAPAGAA